MKRLLFCFGLIFWLLTSFTTQVSAQDPIMFRFRFNVIGEAGKPQTDLDDYNVSVTIVDNSDEMLAGNKREFDLIIIYTRTNRSKFFLGDYISYSTKDKFIRFVDAEAKNYFEFLIDENQVIFQEFLNQNGKTVERYYVQTKEKEERDNLKLYNILMTKAKNGSFHKYQPICVDE